MFKSNRNPQFRSKFSEDIFYNKYSHEGAETFHELACTLVEDVCQNYLTKDEKEELIDHISNLRFLPGGRYLYYDGREKKLFKNSYLLNQESKGAHEYEITDKEGNKVVNYTTPDGGTDVLLVGTNKPK